jgi:hypothetical protein
MPKNTPDDAPEIPEDLTDDSSAYDIPPELAETRLADGPDGQPAAPRSGILKLAAVVALAMAVATALLAYRAHHRRAVLADGLAKADVLLRLDTAAGYREAASLLEPLAQLDPGKAASVRAFALAMLFADYRAREAEAEAEALLVAPGRADTVPAHAHLANAALALGRREAGTATTAATRAGNGPWPRALQARIAFVAGNVEAAVEPAAAAAASGAFPPGLAIHGDALRRLRRDPASARAAYEAALAASPNHPRAAYGLAKLALSGHAPANGAIGALERIVADDGTPGPERGRAALHLATLRLRAGERAAADAALDAVALERPARTWAARAAAVAAENRGPYRAVWGAPPPLQSASDDDPADLSPHPPPPPSRPAASAPSRPTQKQTAVDKRATSKKPASTSTSRR